MCNRDSSRYEKQSTACELVYIKLTGHVACTQILPSKINYIKCPKKNHQLFSKRRGHASNNVSFTTSVNNPAQKQNAILYWEQTNVPPFPEMEPSLNLDLHFYFWLTTCLLQVPYQSTDICCFWVVRQITK